jgi:hypothetical protein
MQKRTYKIKKYLDYFMKAKLEDFKDNQIKQKD